MDDSIKILIVAIIVVAISIVSIMSLVSNIGDNNQYSEPDFSENNAIVGEFVGNYIKAGFMPSWLDVEQGMTPSGKNGLDTVYGFNWEVNGSRFYASTEYNSNNSQVRRNLIRVSFIPLEMNAELATVILDTYFKNHGEVKCANTTVIESPFCESYLMDEGNKVFIGVLSGGFTGESVAFVCQYPVGSEIYSWNSYNSIFKDVGVATPAYTLPGA